MGGENLKPEKGNTTRIHVYSISMRRRWSTTMTTCSLKAQQCPGGKLSLAEILRSRRGPASTQCHAYDGKSLPVPDDAQIGLDLLTPRRHHLSGPAAPGELGCPRRRLGTVEPPGCTPGDPLRAASRLWRRRWTSSGACASAGQHRPSIGFEHLRPIAPPPQGPLALAPGWQNACGTAIPRRDASTTTTTFQPVFTKGALARR